MQNNEDFLQCDIVDQLGYDVPIIVREYGTKAYIFSENSIPILYHLIE